MKYDFDSVINRKNTNSVKWDFKNDYLGYEDDELIPMWVADMDFKAPDVIVDEIIKRAKHGVFGYTEKSNSYYKAVIDWMKKRHGWDIQREWIVTSPGIVPALSWIVRSFTHPGDKVILQSPVYYPFYSAIEDNGCKVVNNPLKFVDGRYLIDFDGLERLMDTRVKVLILSNPHNPVGRVWTREELIRLGEICIKHGVLVVSDEIHSDLIYKNSKHIPYASISEEFAQNSIICTAPSKTFNIAGLQVSNIIIPNNKLRNEFINTLEKNGMSGINIFGMVACEAAYTKGEEWLDELIEYLQGNIDFAMEFVKEKIPEIKVIKPEGTYLLWMDFRELKMDSRELEKFMLKKARIWLDEGYIFGDGGEGFERINIACPRKVLKDALERIERAVKEEPR